MTTWLKDRRKLKSYENNIHLLKEMLSSNISSYCSVNILTALLVEEIQLLKSKNQNDFELSEAFSSQIKDIIKNLNHFALEKGMNKEWVTFALSFWTIEVFPFKFCYSGNNKLYSKPFYSTEISFNKKKLLTNDFSNNTNPISPNINQPFIEYILPSLMPNFPQGEELNKVTIGSYISQKSGLGKITAYSPSVVFEVCDRKGNFIDKKYNIAINDNAPVQVTPNNYFFKNQKYDCFSINNAAPIINLSLTLPSITAPNIAKDASQAPELILFTLENLPSDNNNGLMLIENYLKSPTTSDNADSLKLYAKWLNSVRDSLPACLNTINKIYEKNLSRKDIFDFIESVTKEAKISPRALRKFNLNMQNAFMNKSSRSVLGPIYEEIKPKPEAQLSITQEYTAEKSVFKFKDSLDKKTGGTIYIASQINSLETERAFFYISAKNDYNTLYSHSSFTVWLNGKEIAFNELFLNHEDDVFQQRITLNKGQNNLLIKINGIDGHNWGKNFSFCVGNNFSSSIKGVELKALQQ